MPLYWRERHATSIYWRVGHHEFTRYGIPPLVDIVVTVIVTRREICYWPPQSSLPSKVAAKRYYIRAGAGRHTGFKSVGSPRSALRPYAIVIGRHVTRVIVALAVTLLRRLLVVARRQRRRSRHGWFIIAAATVKVTVDDTPRLAVVVAPLLHYVTG